MAKKKPRSAAKLCVVPECIRLQRLYKSGGRSKYCSVHRSRKYRFGVAGLDIKRDYRRRAAFSGKAWVDSNGYLKVKFFGRAEYVHRILWAIDNGPIPRGFHVHHMDEDKRNNEPSNLYLLTKQEHHRLHASGESLV